MAKTLNWIKQIDYNKFLDGNSALIVDEFGIETLIKLVELFGKTQVYFSHEPIIRLKKEFIRKNKDQYSVQELARLLDCSTGFVYKVVRE